MRRGSGRVKQRGREDNSKGEQSDIGEGRREGRAGIGGAEGRREVRWGEAKED